MFNALDHVTGGRIAWNAVTSRSKNEAANWGYDKLIEHGGFMLARGFSAPGNLQEFVDLVVPELQRRGLTRRQYLGATLRDNLLQ